MLDPEKIHCVTYSISSDVYEATKFSAWLKVELNLFLKREIRPRDHLLLSLHESADEAEAESKRWTQRNAERDEESA